MAANSQRKRWLVVLGSILALTVSNSPILYFTFAIFLKPISAEYGWSRGALSLGITAEAILAGIATPIVGSLIDRWSIQRVTLILITLFSLLVASFALTPNSVTAFVALCALAGLISSGQAPLPYAKSISGWFEQNRGLALGIAMAGVGVGIAVVPQLAKLLLDAFGWRQAYVMLGVLAWVVAFPAVLFCVKDPPVERGAGASAAPLLVGTEVSAALRSRDFWTIAAASFLAVTAITGVTTHMIALLTDRGVSQAFAVSALTGVGIAAIAGRVLSGFLLDLVFAPYLAAAIFFLPLAGVVIFLTGLTTPAYVLVAAISFGVAVGAEVDIIGFLVGRYFGLRRYGQLYGYIFAGFAIGSGVGPSMMGAIFDRTGNYATCLSVFLGFLLVSGVLIASLGKYPYPARPHQASAAADEDASLLSPSL